MKTKKRTTWIMIALLVAMSLILTSCAPTEVAPTEVAETEGAQPLPTKEEVKATEVTAPTEAPVPEEEVNFIFANLSDPASVDPAKVYGGAARVTAQVYEPLLRFDPSGEVIPFLAKEWQVEEDCKAVTIILRDDVKFHDGTDFNAEAVKFSVDRFIKIGASTSWAFKRVMDEGGTVVVDEYTVKFNLSKPYCSFPNLLALGVGIGIISPSIMEHEVNGDMGQEWATKNMVGTGPYKLVEWTPQEQMVFEKFDEYWGGWEGKHFTRLIYKAVPEQTTRRLMVENGEAHFSVYPADEELELIEANPNTKAFVFTRGQNPYTFTFLLNTQHGVLTDIRLREALSWIFPYEKFVKEAARGMGIQSVGPIPIVLPAHNKDVFVYHQDLDKARELLAEAGYPNGKGLKLTLYFSIGDDKIAQVLVSACEEVGITVDSQVNNWTAMLNAMSSPDTAPDIALGSGFLDFPEVESFLRSYVTTYWWRGDSVDTYYYWNEEFAQLIETVPFEIDAAKKTEMENRLQEILVEDIAGIWVYNKDQFWIMDKRVNGIVYNPWYYNVPYFYEMYFEE